MEEGEEPKRLIYGMSSGFLKQTQEESLAKATDDTLRSLKSSLSQLNNLGLLIECLPRGLL